SRTSPTASVPACRSLGPVPHRPAHRMLDITRTLLLPLPLLLGQDALRAPLQPRAALQPLPPPCPLACFPCPAGSAARPLARACPGARRGAGQCPGRRPPTGAPPARPLPRPSLRPPASPPPSPTPPPTSTPPTPPPPTTTPGTAVPGVVVGQCHLPG